MNETIVFFSLQKQGLKSPEQFYIACKVICVEFAKYNPCPLYFDYSKAL